MTAKTSSSRCLFQKIPLRIAPATSAAFGKSVPGDKGVGTLELAAVTHASVWFAATFLDYQFFSLGRTAWAAPGMHGPALPLRGDVLLEMRARALLFLQWPLAPFLTGNRWTDDATRLLADLASYAGAPG